MKSVFCCYSLSHFHEQISDFLFLNITARTSMFLLVKLYSWGQEDELVLKTFIMALHEFSNPYFPFIFPGRSNIFFSPIPDTCTSSESCYTHTHICTHYLFARLFKSRLTQIHANLIEATVQTYQGLKQANLLMY